MTMAGLPKRPLTRRQRCHRRSITHFCRVFYHSATRAKLCYNNSQLWQSHATTPPSSAPRPTGFWGASSSATALVTFALLVAASFGMAFVNLDVPQNPLFRWHKPLDMLSILIVLDPLLPRHEPAVRRPAAAGP